MSFTSVIRPKAKSKALPFDLLCIGMGSAFLALLSQISIPLWFTPVPLTLQTFAVALIAALLGSRRGAMCVLTYLLEGALGLPVFAGGRGGCSALFGPTGGYLFGFILSAYVIGFFLERGWRQSYTRTLAALYIGSMLTLSSGALWLSFFIGGQNALALGVYPFLVGDLIKTLAATSLIPFAWKYIDEAKHSKY